MPSSQYDRSEQSTDNGHDPIDDSPALDRSFQHLADHVIVTQDDNQHSETDMPESRVPYRPSNAASSRKGNINGGNENGHTTGSYNLPPLQAQGNLDEGDSLDPIYDDDPTSYDLVAPPSTTYKKDEYSLEKRSQALFSSEHLQVILSDPNSLLKFTTFLGAHHTQSVPILVHYLDTLKAIRAIHYANAILDGLDPVEELEFTKQTITPTKNEVLEARARTAFDHLVKHVLPVYITHQYIQVVSTSISARISGLLSPNLREASEGLAEVFCLTDPSRPDNPIVFASEGWSVPFSAA